MATVNAKVQVGVNSEIYRDCVDTDLKIKKIIKTRKEKIAEYTVIISTVIFEDVVLNNGNKFKFKNNNEGIDVILEDIDTENTCPELFNSLIDFTALPKDKYTLNQIIRAINITRYGGKYRRFRAIYSTSINIPRKQDVSSSDYDLLALSGNNIVYENFLVNLVFVQEINLKRLEPVNIRLPFASDTNISYIQTSHFEYHRTKYFILGEAPRLHSTNKLFMTSVDDFESEKECYLVNFIDGNKVNNSIKNLELVRYGDSTRATNKNLSYRFYLYNIKTNEKSKVFNNQKELADYVYTKNLFGEKASIYSICNALAESLILGTSIKGYKAIKFCDDEVGKAIVKNRKTKYIYYAKILSTNEIRKFESEIKFKEFIAEYKGILYTAAARYFRNYFNTREIDEIDPRLKLWREERIEKVSGLLFDV